MGWRNGDRGMPTHKRGCQGCDCARILLNLTDPDTLTLTFWMSPPVVHADFVFTRAGAAPPFITAVQSTMAFPYQQCRMRNHYGPNIPFEPDLRNRTDSFAGGCAFASRHVAQALMKEDDKSFDLKDMLDEPPSSAETQAGRCRQLNGLNLRIDNMFAHTDKAMNVSDVRIQYVPPRGRCEPCDVSYSVSAKIQSDEYIGFGFKGQSWEGRDPYPPETSRPCYFGMCVDPYDNFTSDRIAVGYTSDGGCVREMTTDQVIGAPSDVDFPLLKATSVERSGDRTVMRFTVSQHWPRATLDGPFRVMWAIGKVGPRKGSDACAAPLSYHFNQRGVAPIKWLGTLGSTRCKFDVHEFNAPAAQIVV